MAQGETCSSGGCGLFMGVVCFMNILRVEYMYVAVKIETLL